MCRKNVIVNEIVGFGGLNDLMVKSVVQFYRILEHQRKLKVWTIIFNVLRD